jgi:uncharacterized protein (TIGR02145 family)
MSNNNGIVCDGSITLYASNAVGRTVKWFDTATSASPVSTGTMVVNTPYTTVYAEMWEGGCIGDRSSYTTGSIGSTPYLKTISTPPNNKMTKKEPFSFAVNGDYLAESTVYTWSATPSEYATIINQGNKVASILFDDGNFEDEFDAVVSVVAGNECGSGEAISTASIRIENNCRPVNQPEITQNSLKAYAYSPFTLAATITGGNTIRTVRWYKTVENVAIPIANSNSLSFTHTETEADSYQYYCVVWPNCGTEEADGQKSSHITVEVEMNPVVIPAASGGILRGKACFDIAATNAAGRTTTYARLEDRQQKNKTDFSTLAPVTYTFVANITNVSNLRFMVIDTDSCVQSITGNLTPGTVSQGNTATIQLKYKEDLNLATSRSNIVGRTRAQAAKVIIYAIYSDGAKDVALSLTADIMDDVCCGVKTITGGWKNFMCHNLGADSDLDPFTPREEIVGDYYQWGQKEPLVHANTDATATGTRIPNSTTIPNGSWSETRGPQDPCPFGWRVPSIAEFESIGKKDNNRAQIIYLPDSKWSTSTAYNKGIVLGELLMFTGAGYRNNELGTWVHRDSHIHYLSSSNTSSATYAYRWVLSPTDNSFTYDDKHYIRSVRCIADE